MSPGRIILLVYLALYLVRTSAGRELMLKRRRALARAVPLVGPQDFSVCLVQADNPFLSREQLAEEIDVPRRRAVMQQLGLGRVDLACQSVHDKDSTRGDRRPRVTATKFGFPAQLGTSFWECFKNTSFSPDGITLGTEPLWPVVGLGR